MSKPKIIYPEYFKLNCFNYLRHFMDIRLLMSAIDHGRDNVVRYYLEDALDDLKAEFEKMMGDKEEGDDEDSEEAPMDDMGDDEEKEEEAFAPESDLSVADEVPAFEGTKSNTEQMREYVEKIAEPKGEDNKAKSPVAGANNMGGTTANIAKGSSEEKGGTVSAPKTEDGGNVNVPGGKASKSMSNAKGHGAEKKGAGETGTDGKSIIGSK